MKWSLAASAASLEILVLVPVVLPLGLARVPEDAEAVGRGVRGHLAREHGQALDHGVDHVLLAHLGVGRARVQVLPGLEQQVQEGRGARVVAGVAHAPSGERRAGGGLLPGWPRHAFWPAGPEGPGARVVARSHACFDVWCTASIRLNPLRCALALPRGAAPASAALVSAPGLHVDFCIASLYYQHI